MYWQGGDYVICGGNEKGGGEQKEKGKEIERGGHRLKGLKGNNQEIYLFLFYF